MKLCNRAGIGIGIVLFCCLVAPPRAQADGGVGIVTASLELLGTVFGTFGARVDRTANYVLENRALLEALGERFDAFAMALNSAMEAIDGLDEVIRRDLEDAFDEYQHSRILGLADLIVQDAETVARGGAVTVDPHHRLHDLQREVRTLFRRSDLNAPVLLTALGYELPLLAALGAGAQEIVTTRRSYEERLLRSLDAGRSNSLASNYLTLRRDTEGDIRASGVREKLDFFRRRSGYLIGRCAGPGGTNRCLSGYSSTVGVCERYWGEELTGEGEIAREGLDRLEEQIRSARRGLENARHKADVLVAWQKILVAIEGELSGELPGEDHRIALGEEASPDRLASRVSAEIRELDRITRNIDAAQRGYLTEAHHSEFHDRGLCL